MHLLAIIVGLTSMYLNVEYGQGAYLQLIV